MISHVGDINSNQLVCETLPDSSARNVFFSFLMISQVGCINSNNAVSETLSDSSAWNVFFSFLIISQHRWIIFIQSRRLVKHCVTVLLGTFFFFFNYITGGLYQFELCG